MKSNKNKLLDRIGRYREELGKKEKILSSIYRISQLLNRHANLDEILHAILNESRKIFGYSRGAVLLLNKEQERLETIHGIGFTPEEELHAFTHPISMKTQVCRETIAAKTGKTIYARNVNNDPNITGFDRKMDKFWKRTSTVSVPLKINREVIGIIDGTDRVDGGMALSKSDIRLFTTFSNHASIILENARLYEQLLTEKNIANRMAGDLQKTTVSKEYMDNIIKTMPCALIVMDLQGAIISLNKGALILLEYTEEEIMGVQMSSFFPARDLPNIGLIKTLAQKGEVLRTEKECVTKGGAIIPVLLSAVMNSSEDYIVCVILDIRERKRLEIELRHAQKLESIGQLAAGIAHEINTPTQFIGDNTRFLHDAFEELKPVLQICKDMAASGESTEVVITSEMLDSLHRADIDYLLEEIPLAIQQSTEGVERVSKIVKSMKEFSHPGGNTKKSIDLNHAIETTLTISKNEWKYVANLELDLEPELPSVLCLPGDLNQAILNIIVNAAHAIEAKVGHSPREKGTITVRTRKDADNVFIQIQDTGIGIPAEIHNRIFDPFFTTKEVGRGTGQGLSITYSIVIERHGGTLSFDTEMGEGTTFTISIPILSSPVTDEFAVG